MTALLFISLPKLSVIVIAGLLYIYFDYKYCSYIDFKSILVIKSFPLWLTKIFYKLIYKTNHFNKEECGYVLVKRVWLWILFSPIILIYLVAKYAIWITFDYFLNLFYFQSDLIESDEIALLNSQKNDLIKKLIK